MTKSALVVYRDFAYVQPYARALEAAGVTPVLAGVGTPVSLNGYSGLLLTGGDDVNPKHYGESPWPETESPDDELDELELSLIPVALERDIPLLAICRGLQILNVYMGGTLIQHLDSTTRHRKRTPDRGAPAHHVKIEPDTLLAAVAQREVWHVNSRHHQAIGKLGRGLRVSARDLEDGTIEAVEYPERRFVLAVQWHPEDQAPGDPEQQKLFDAFSAAL